MSSHFISVVCAAVLACPLGVSAAVTDPPAAMPSAWVGQRQEAVSAPVKGLTPDQIYHILAAEVAARRGQMGQAAQHYLQAAELTRSPALAELAVRAGINADEDATAGRAMLLWLQLAPNAPEAQQLAALLRVRARDREGALIHLQRLVELAGGSGEIPFAKVVAVLSWVPDADERLALMSSLAERFPHDPDAQQTLAMLAASLSRYEVAEAAAWRALALRPDWNVPRLFLVRLRLNQGERAQARALLDEFIAATPNDQSLKLLYGQLLVDERDFAQARAVFEEILRAQPHAPDVLFALGILSLQLEDLAAANRYFTDLHATGQRQDEAAFYLGQTAERAQDLSGALGWYARVNGAYADDARIRMAFLRAKRGEIAQAREILQQLRDQSPDDAVSLFLAEAEILDEMGHADEARAVYEEALAAFPDNERLLYARGLLAMKRGQLELGEADLRRIIAANPDHADALNALGYTLADHNQRLDEALTLIERAHALKPDEPAILDSLGWVHYRLGNLDRALQYLERANTQIEDGEIAAHLGEVLWALGRRADAWAVWDKASAKYPDHAYLKSTINRHRLSQTDVQPLPTEVQQ
ncbi:tetratricopeptide repeat protein [Caldichromatium japonicum]|nr:tetratricopeptide repeat protein [Caldichromatium japonicum]